ncbi:DUF1223 domain-containing protein [Roseovarius rhodophyticola]|uniref:DUF1223 domain-containing protein n=1 Tax=Roseovarius rhodophyticola TaxID=3080827 RepID=A0ABZ2TLB0_9RHOB|nr:DUF1223 domain-containing protein [Roseovarius sp. W115]MDV2929523.1 DUF1223 domain-containing protein [Roseovarius sp. W115]
MRRIIAFAIAVGLWAVPAFSQSKAVVVELFTSQGCSSCPPADEFLHELAKRDDVVALALHVDYWDYIGWKDSFAHPGHADRQRAYAAENGRRMIYTPQMVINGREHVVGNSPIDVSDMINRHLQTPSTVHIDLSRVGDDVLIEAEPMTQFEEPLAVRVVRYMPESSVNITRGENAGHTINYANVVTDMAQVGSWTGEEALRLTVPAQGDQPIVVVLQRRDGIGLVEAAAQLK